LLNFDSQDDVLEDLVQGMPGVQAAISVRRSIVQDKFIVGRAISRLPLVEIIGTLLDVLVPVLWQRTRTAGCERRGL
jgi:hypothetical protein